MTYTIQNILSRVWMWVLTGAVAICGWSCRSDNPLAEPGEDEPDPAVYELGLYLQLGDGQIGAKGSRTTPAGDYDPGADFENYIHIDGENSDFRLYLLDLSDYLIATVENPTITRLSTAPGRKTYELRFEVDKSFRDGYQQKPFKILMLANRYGRYPNALPGISKLKDLTDDATGVMDYGKDAWPSDVTADSRIPMFGIVQFAGVELDPTNMVILPETLHLLRALAKVEVTDAAGSSDAITGAALTRHNTRFAMSPSGVRHQDDYVKYVYDYDYVATLTVPADCETSDVMSFGKSAATGKFTTYVPEYRNTGRQNNQRAQLRVRYADGAYFDLDLKYYQNPAPGASIGDPFDLRRNYYYKFTVKRSDVDVAFVVDVLPYGEVELKPGFGIDPENPDHPHYPDPEPEPAP